MAKQKTATPSYLAGRTRNRSGVDFATSDEQVEDIQQEVSAITDFSSIPPTPLELIDSNPFQYRRKMDEKKLQELENEMEREGITSAIVGRYSPEDRTRVQIAYGHRRIKVIERLNARGVKGFEGYPILIKNLTDRQMRLLAISENRFREDPSLVDEAFAFQSLIEADFTQEEAAKYYGISRGTFREILALTEDEPEIQDMVERKSDTLRAARDIRKVTDPEIRTQVIQDLLDGVITGTQVPAHIETLQQEKQNRLELVQEKQMYATLVKAKEESSDFISLPPSTTAPSSIFEQNDHQPHLSVVLGNAASASALNEPLREAEQPYTQIKKEASVRSRLIKETQQKSATLVEQSRLRSWCKHIEDYGKRLDKRIREQQPIPVEETEQLQQLYQLIVSQLEKVSPQQ